jgi:host factor-I protein
VERRNADLQSDFLGALMANRTPVWVFLVNGIKSSGVIGAFDKFAVSVRSPSGMQFINKSAISTIIEQHANPVAPTRVPTDRPGRPPPGGQS